MVMFSEWDVDGDEDVDVDGRGMRRGMDEKALCFSSRVIITYLLILLSTVILIVWNNVYFSMSLYYGSITFIRWRSVLRTLCADLNIL